MSPAHEKKALPAWLAIAAMALRREFPALTDEQPFQDLLAKLHAIPDIKDNEPPISPQDD